jgi:hypothetical protein
MAGLDAVDDENFGVEDAAEEAVDLSVYGDAGVRAALKERNRLAVERQKYYDDLTAKITAQRAGPSFSERMYQLSAALAAPTTTRGFSGVMGNVMPVLQKQQQAQREGEVKRQDALNALQAAQLNQRAGSAQQDVTTALAMAKIKNQRPPAEFSYQLDPSGVVREVPKKVYRPKNEAEYAAIPIGQYYAVPSGPDAGKVLVKR